MAQEMTMRAKVFTAYAEAVIAKHGFGSGKMVAHGSPDYIRQEVMRGQRLIDRATWAKDSASIDCAVYEAAVAGGNEGKRLWSELDDAEKWLIANGWLAEYFHTYRVNYGITGRIRGQRYIGLTAKGWAVAQKYIERKEN